MALEFPPVPRLKRRRDFLRAAAGMRFHGRAFSLQAAGIDAEPAQSSAPARFGITVTKRIGGAVERNRIKRRFKEALRLSPALPSQPGRDYVIVAKAEALTADFRILQSELSTAILKIDRRARPRPKKPESGKSKAKSVQSGAKSLGSKDPTQTS